MFHTHKSGILPVQCDVTDESSIDAAFAKIDEEYGHLEVLFNSAGGEKGTGTPLPDFKRDDWDFTINLDLTSIFTMNKKGAKYMEEKISSGKQSYGRIINIASIYGMVGNTAIPTIAYHASKGAVVNFTRAAAEKSFHFLRRSSRPFSIVLLSLYRDIRADFYRICLLLF